MNRKQHWEKVYETKDDHEIGWFQKLPKTSISLINKYAQSQDISVIDIGGGNSFLTKFLFNEGYSNLTVLDISVNALQRSLTRFGNDADKINWKASDILEFSTHEAFQIWHDRAVFHFLIDDGEIKKYADVADKSIAQGGFLIIGTFSTTGPKKCSGLPVTQYSEEKICTVFNQNFKLVECFDDVHTTPSGNAQNFIWAVFRKRV